MDTSNTSSDGSASEVLSKITASIEAFTRNEPGAREKLLLHTQHLTATLETPSEAIQRVGWAEVNSHLVYKSPLIIVILCSRLALQPYDSQSIWTSSKYSKGPAVLLSAFRSLQIRQGQKFHWLVSLQLSLSLIIGQRIISTFLIVFCSQNHETSLSNERR